MKTRVAARSVLALALAVFGLAHPPTPAVAQSPLSLDGAPAFDFGDDPAAEPLFMPQLLGLATGTPGFSGVNALAAFADEVGHTFPPGLEVFVAYWGNPGYALLGETAVPPAPLSAGSSLGLASAFRPPRTPGRLQQGRQFPETVVPGRSALGMAAEATQVSLAGVRYELPAGSRWVSPLVLDLDGDGRLSASHGLWLPHPGKLTGPFAAFDMDGDGFKDITEWIGPGDGLLVTTTNPASGRDLVGTVGGWRDGFEHLAARFDSDHNGRVEASELNGLYVWQDLNTNGIADAGEVASAAGAGIVWVAATNHGDDTSFFRLTGMDWDWRVYDWWPNYALANRRAAEPPAPGHPLLNGPSVEPLCRKYLFDWIPNSGGPAAPRWLTAPCHISPAQLAAAGIDPASFRLALLADGGQALIGFDTVSTPGQPDRLRLLRIRPGPNAAEQCVLDAVMLPFEHLFQVACDPAGTVALVLGEHGARLALVDLARGTVTPPAGLELSALGLRASGLAGDPMVRYSGTGNFWFSGWQLNEQGEVVDERVWALTPWGFWGGLSLDALRNELGDLRSCFVTGPTSGFFAVPGPGGTNEQLWSVVGTNRTLVDTAESFGAMHAICLPHPTGDAGVRAAVAYTKRDGDRFTFAVWQGGTNATLLSTNGVPWFYPLLTDGGGTAIAARLSPTDGTMSYGIADLTTPGHKYVDWLTAHPGQGRVARGAFAHYGTNGLDIIPLPEAGPPSLPDRIWQYSLLPGSQLTDECPVCGKPPTLLPMRGTFRLRLLQENPLFSSYAVEDLAFEAGSAGLSYKVTGGGVYHVGGEVGLMQAMWLEVSIADGQTNLLCYFTNRVRAVTRLWPMLQITLDQTNGTFIRTFTLDLAAAPLRELWFSTGHGFHPGVGNPPTNYVSPGDLVSSTGRVVKRNSELTGRLGIMPVVPDLGLDAVDVLPGGEMAFSAEENVFSEVLGPLHHGDLLSDRGRIVRGYADLIGPFQPEPPPADQGLDAVQVLADGEVLFSVEADFFSESLGRTIRKGDLLSSRGVVVKTNEELLARFAPAFPKDDYGLDAVYVWPSGEVWFSVEKGFYGSHFEFYGPGDLLSDQGYVVYRNLELLAAFEPLEDLADFGLDALYVVSDLTEPAVGARFTRVGRQPGTANLQLEWEAGGRLFQLEKATNVLGPYRPVGPITTESTFTESAVLANEPSAFYRLRQW